MKKPASLLVAIALTTLASAAASGCAGPEVRLTTPYAPSWHDTGTPTSTKPRESDVRDRRDESGAKMGGAS
jgi:hypothetical protein